MFHTTGAWKGRFTCLAAQMLMAVPVAAGCSSAEQPGDPDGNVPRPYDFSKEQLPRSLDEYTNAVFALAFSPDGTMLATAGAPWEKKGPDDPNFCGWGQLYLWKVSTKEHLAALDWEPKEIWLGYGRAMTVAFSPDGESLYAGTTDILHSYGGGLPRATHFDTHYMQFKVHTRKWSQGVGGFRADENAVLKKYSDDRQLNKMWQLVRSPVRQEEGAIAHATCTWKIIQRTPISDIKSRKGPPGFATCIAYSPDGKMLATGGGPENDVKLWDIAQEGDVKTPLATLQHKDLVTRIAFTPDGTTLAAGSEDSRLTCWDVAKRQERFSIIAHEKAMNALAMSPDGKLAATGGMDKTIKLWDVESGKELTSWPDQKGRIQALAFSPDGKLLASSACDPFEKGEVKLWSAAKLLEKKGN